jgi:TatA/E family protein of Tat protein translocase
MVLSLCKFFDVNDFQIQQRAFGRIKSGSGKTCGIKRKNHATSSGLLHERQRPEVSGRIFFHHQDGVFFMDIGGPELLLILAAILVLFGGQKIPELSRGLGKGMRGVQESADRHRIGVSQSDE